MTWKSEISDKSVIIDDDTPSVATPDGFSNGYEPRDYSAYPAGFYAPELGDDWLIPREDWYQEVKDRERLKIDLRSFLRRKGWKVKNQNGTNFCWCFGVVTAVEIMRLLEGQEYVELSAASSACVIKSFANRGGWGDQAAEFIAKRGVVQSLFGLSRRSIGDTTLTPTGPRPTSMLSRSGTNYSPGT